MPKSRMRLVRLLRKLSNSSQCAPPGVFPPLLGQKFVRWTDMFKLIKQPKLLWTNWGPKKSLEQYTSIEELWTAYVDGALEMAGSKLKV
ncbi:hypothetical protein B0H14DRAFT_3444643 [Mycena olivaceomarginata]|nr:hypothetical protein B0H14DRAFT_3444643 [Mycena olivaceomarginata]